MILFYYQIRCSLNSNQNILNGGKLLSLSGDYEKNKQHIDINAFIEMCYKKL